MPLIMNLDCPACGEAFPRRLDDESECAVAVARAELAAECPDHDEAQGTWDENGGGGLDTGRWEAADQDGPD